MTGRNPPVGDNHPQGPVGRFRAVAFCVWASYSTLSVLGLIHPLRMLPIMLFVIGYKAIWLATVAYPLWRAGTLAGSPAEEMTYVFLWLPLPIIAVPWAYVFRTYVMWPSRKSSPGAQPGRTQAAAELELAGVRGSLVD